MELRDLRELHKLLHDLQARAWADTEELAILVPALEWVEARIYKERGD